MTLRHEPLPGPAPLAFRLRAGRPLRVNVVSETAMLGLTHQGGHTAFLDAIDLLRLHPDLEVHVNSDRPCDVIHSHSWGPYALWRGRGMAGRRVITAHVVPETAVGTFPLARVGAPVVRGWLRAVYDWADVVISVAPATTTSLARLGVTSRIETVPNALRAERFRPSAALRIQGRRWLEVDPRAPLVLGVGQIQPRKGIEDFAEVARAMPEVTFVWVGGRPFGPVSAGLLRLERLMRRPPPNLRFAGRFALEQMPAIHNAADAMLFPSFQENCPYAPIEAAACGVPVVYRDLPEYAALYTEPYLRASDPAGFVARLALLLGSPEARRRWSAAGRRQAARFTTSGWLARIARIYDHLAT